MKNTHSIFIYVAIATIFASCNMGGKNINEVKLIPVKNGKEFQYIDQEGKIVINPQFAQASIFRNGLALVQTSGDKPQWGFIGVDGKYAIIANYKSATVFSEDLAWVVSENAAPAAINTKGEVKFTLQNAEVVQIFSEGLAAFSQITEEGENKWGFVDKEGKVKINPQFSSVEEFREGKCPVRNKDGKWGYIDKEGKIVINPQFDGAASFHNGNAVVHSGEKAGVIDANGKYVINPQFSSMANDGDLFKVVQDGKYGWTDKEGKIIINPQFSDVYPFTNGKLAAVQSGKNWGYIDKEGKIVINPQFDKAFPFNGKLALVISASKIGFIDNEGKYVINPQFDDVSRDLVTYYLSGGSDFSNVYTDFFNIGAITSRIKIDAPEGLTFNTPMSEILTKFKKSESDFSRYSSEHQIIYSEKITNDASVDFFIVGTPWESYQKGTGWSQYTDYRLNLNYKPTGFAYRINLTGKGYGKKDVVKTAFEQSLTGYTKDASASNEREVIYKNDKQSIKILFDGEKVIIFITADGKEIGAIREEHNTTIAKASYDSLVAVAAAEAEAARYRRR